MRRDYLLPLLILLTVSAPWTAALAQQRGDRITAPYMAGTVRITARFTGGGIEEGFGFIVGERNDDLFLVTANHLIEHPPERAARIEVQFSTAPDETYQARWLKSKGHLDLALLKIADPDIGVPWRQAAWCTAFERGDKVWFIGRNRDWFVPLDREAGDLYASEPDEDDRLQFAISSVRPGTSGAPLIHERGIVGMITKDLVNGAQAVSANKIRRFVQERGYPWQLRRCGDTAVLPPGPAATTPKPTGKIPFTVKTSPADARVRILNIAPKYRDGIELKPGRYRIEVTETGFRKHLSWFDLTPENSIYAVELAPLAAAAPTLPPPSPAPTPIIRATNTGRVFRDRLAGGGEGPPMVTVPKGCFRMGDIQGGGSKDERPVHQVCLEPFAIGVNEVTFEDYDRFAAATGRYKPDDMGWGRGRRPVVKGTWHDALAYTEWLSAQTGRTYGLPTEAQWEYAARAGTETKYWWGNQIGRNRANCDGCGSRWDNEQTAPVGLFAANPFGLHDTAGNVWEWTCSEYTETYEGSEQSCVSNNRADSPVLRGGSWNNNPRNLRAANCNPSNGS